MGAPVVTLAGQSHISRVGVSLLSSIGLPELIGRTTDEYIEIAKDFSHDWERLDSLRRSMRDRMLQSPLMDSNAFARDVENSYRQMWHVWCDNR